MSQISEFVAAKIREFRKLRKLSQAHLAEQMNTAKNTISRWENHLYTPSITDLEKLAEALGVAAIDFFPEQSPAGKAAEFVTTVPVLQSEKRSTLRFKGNFRQGYELAEPIVATSIPITKYMHTNYRPDRVFIDGELRERNVGLYPHARTMALLASWFSSHEEAWGVMTALSLRLKVSPTRMRVPDVVLLSRGRYPDVLAAPPVLIVEIISPEDTVMDTDERIDDYLKIGVSLVWLIDPTIRKGWSCVETARTAASHLVVPGTDIRVDLPTLFSELNED